MAQYTGHSAKHDGLQGHSVGDLYPIIITHYGDGSQGLMLGDYELRGLSPDRHIDYLLVLHATYVLQGWGEAVAYFKRIGAKPVRAH